MPEEAHCCGLKMKEDFIGLRMFFVPTDVEGAAAHHSLKSFLLWVCCLHNQDKQCVH